jgi:hypothetical protein
MAASVIAAALALGLAGYLIVTDWIDLAPWNNVEDMPTRQKVLISLANYTPLLFIAFAISQANVVFVLLAVIVGGIDLIMHVAYWWLPYIRGATAEHVQEHARMFGGTTSFLPAIGDHSIPNAQHVVVGLLMVAMVAATIATAIGSRSAS